MTFAQCVFIVAHNNVLALCAPRGVSHSAIQITVQNKLRLNKSV